MATKYGFQGTLNVNSGTYGTPVWNPVTNVEDVTVSADFTKQDATTRVSSIKQFEPTTLEIAISGKLRTDQTDTNGYILFETNFYTRAVMDLLVLDASATTNGAHGLRFDSKLFKFDEDQTNSSVLFREWELAPCVSTNPGNKAINNSGTMVYTAI